MQRDVIKRELIDSTNKKLLERNLRIYYLNAFISMMAFFLPVMTLFFNQIMNSVFLVALLFSIQAGVGLIFEIPTSSIADLFGRKKTMLLAGIITVISFIFLASANSFAMLLIFSLLFSLKIALNSGTEEALLYDSLKELKREKEYKKLRGHLYMLSFVGGIIGAVAGGFMAGYSLRLPFILSIPIALVSLCSTFFLTEAKYKKERHSNIFKHMHGSVKFLFKNKQLLLLVAFGLFAYGLSESAFHLTQIYYNFVNLPVSFFGIVAAAGSLLGSFGALSSHTLSKKMGDKKALILSFSLYAFSLILASIFLGYIGVAFIALMSLFGATSDPIKSHLMNKEIASNNRATVLSLSSFVNNLGYIIFAPFLGYLADVYDIATAFKISGALLFILVIFLFFIKDRE